MNELFRWHKRFKDGREVKDEETCGPERDVKISELVEKIHDFLHEDCRVSLKTISTHFRVGVTTVHNCLYTIRANFVPRVLSEENSSKQQLYINGHQNSLPLSLQYIPSTLWLLIVL